VSAFHLNVVSEIEAALEQRPAMPR
jgi:hypothetical protein